MGLLDKIADIEREMARTQKNKGVPSDSPNSPVLNYSLAGLKLVVICRRVHMSKLGIGSDTGGGPGSCLIVVDVDRRMPGVCTGVYGGSDRGPSWLAEG